MKCPNGSIIFIEKVFGECVLTTSDKISFGIGIISIVFWLSCSSPQIFQNCMLKRVEGISPLFFTLIFIGDIIGLIGLFVKKDILSTQIVLGFVFLILDGILFIQYLYYQHVIHKCCIEKDIEENFNNEKTNEIPNYIWYHFPVNSLLFTAQLSYSLELNKPYKGKELIGTIFGWISFGIYFGSRIPQVLMNCKYKTIGDINIYFILLSVLGNISYIFSVLIKSFKIDYLWSQLPYLLGAIGPMICDLILMFQSKLYKNHNDIGINSN